MTTFTRRDASIWRTIQSRGLTTRYRADEDVRHFIGMLDGLAFLPVDDVPDGMLYLRDNIPEGLDPLVDYFDLTSVTGSATEVTSRAAGRPDLCNRISH